MLNVYVLFMIGVAVGSILSHGFTYPAFDNFLDAFIYSGVFGVILSINGTYTAS